MQYSLGILLMLGGLGILGYGLYLFYAWLPLLYALFGFESGLLLGWWLSGELALLAIALGIAGAIAGAGAAYVLEPYRRIIFGYVAGALLALSLAHMLNLDHLVNGVFGAILMIGGGLLGAAVVSRYFDLLIISASALGGATLVVSGAQLLLPTPSDPAHWSALPALVTVVLTVLGMRWQLSNLAHWTAEKSTAHEALIDPTRTQSGSGKR